MGDQQIAKKIIVITFIIVFIIIEYNMLVYHALDETFIFIKADGMN